MNFLLQKPFNLKSAYICSDLWANLTRSKWPSKLSELKLGINKEAHAKPLPWWGYILSGSSSA